MDFLPIPFPETLQIESYQQLIIAKIQTSGPTAYCSFLTLVNYFPPILPSPLTGELVRNREKLNFPPDHRIMDRNLRLQYFHHLIKSR